MKAKRQINESVLDELHDEQCLTPEEWHDILLVHLAPFGATDNNRYMVDTGIDIPWPETSKPSPLAVPYWYGAPAPMMSIIARQQVQYTNMAPLVVYEFVTMTLIRSGKAKETYQGQINEPGKHNVRSLRSLITLVVHLATQWDELSE